MNERAHESRRSSRGVRGKALGAATELLTKVGMENLSIRTIAARAGIGISSMYHYFPNKEELLLNIALSGFQNLKIDMRQSRDADPALSPFARAARVFLDKVAGNAPLYHLMFNEHLMARHEALRTAERETFTVFSECVAVDDRFPPAIAESLALTLWTLGRGMAASAASRPDGQLTPELRASVAQAMAYLIDRRL